MPNVNSTGMVLAQTVVKNSADMKGWARDVELAAQRVVYQLGIETRDMAKKRAPVRTGALRASIYVTRPATDANQAAGKFSRGQASAGYFRAAMAAAGRNPANLEVIVDDPFISKRTQRDLSTAGHVNHFNRIKLSKVHTGANRKLGSQTYVAFEEDYRSIMPMGDNTRGTFFVTIGVAAFYAGYVEYGTVHSAAQPFLTPAVVWARGQLEGRLAAAIGAEKARAVVK